MVPEHVAPGIESLAEAIAGNVETWDTASPVGVEILGFGPAPKIAIPWPFTKLLALAKDKEELDALIVPVVVVPLPLAPYPVTAS